MRLTYTYRVVYFGIDGTVSELAHGLSYQKAYRLKKRSSSKDTGHGFYEVFREPHLEV